MKKIKSEKDYTVFFEKNREGWFVFVVSCWGKIVARRLLILYD